MKAACKPAIVVGSTLLSEVAHTALFVDERGQPLFNHQQRYRFDRVRKTVKIDTLDFPFWDLRPKTGTDEAESVGDIRQAQKELGRASSVVITETYV